jgi:hypothetical protein
MPKSRTSSPTTIQPGALRLDMAVKFLKGVGERRAEQLERLGIRTVLIDLNRLEDLGPAARTLGRLTGLEQRAESLARAMDGFTSTNLHQPPPTSTTVFSDPAWTWRR